MHRLTYSNVMATIAVFIALGGGAYALTRGEVKSKHIAKNAVRTKHIKNKQVRTGDLRDGAVNAAKLASAIRPLHFDGDAADHSLNDIILDQDGYRVTMACQNDGGAPQLDGSLRVPEDGTLDLQGVHRVRRPRRTTAGATQVPVEAATPFSVDVSNPAGGETRTTGVVVTYSGSTRSALITVHGVADDDTDTLLAERLDHPADAGRLVSPAAAGRSRGA